LAAHEIVRRPELTGRASVALTNLYIVMPRTHAGFIALLFFRCYKNRVLRRTLQNGGDPKPPLKNGPQLLSDDKF
jgi:hypothetical protein